MIGTEAASKAAPDGYTFLLTPERDAHRAAAHAQDALRSPRASCPSPASAISSAASSCIPRSGPKTFKEMIDYAKANPGKLSYGSAGLGTATHLRIEMLKYRAGIDILHVPYRGSADALNDLLPNTVQMMNEINVIPHVKAGKLHPAQHQPQRAPPGIPGCADADRARHPTPTCRSGISIFAPAGTPKEIIAKLNAKIVEIAKTDEMKAKMRAINVVVPMQTPEEMAKHLVEDTKPNAEVIKAANIKIDEPAAGDGESRWVTAPA